MKKIFFVLLTVLVALSACNGEGGDKKKKVNTNVISTSSAPYELLVVADKAWLKTQAGLSLIEMVETPVEGLPGREASFRTTKISSDALKGTFTGYAHIVIAEVSKKYKEKAVRVAEDVYCHPQTIIYLEAPTNEDFIELTAECKDVVLGMFNQQELDREHRYLAKNYSQTAMKQAKKQFGVTIKAPKDIDEVKEGKDFFWATTEKQENRLNLCMYTLPLRDYTLDEFAAARDSLMKINIPGGRDDQWMETDARTITSGSWESKDGKLKAITVRGLWDMRNDAMGGPFVSYLYTDAKNNRVFVVEGFIWCPQEKKRAMIKSLEASLQTITNL